MGIVIHIFSILHHAHWLDLLCRPGICVQCSIILWVLFNQNQIHYRDNHGPRNLKQYAISSDAIRQFSLLRTALTPQVLNEQIINELWFTHHIHKQKAIQKHCG